LVGGCGADEDVLTDASAEEVEARADLVCGVRTKVGNDIEFSPGDSLAELLAVACVGDQRLHSCGQLPAGTDPSVHNRDDESALDGERDAGRADGAGAADEKRAGAQGEPPLGRGITLLAERSHTLRLLGQPARPSETGR
jgi:hypothetical protein